MILKVPRTGRVVSAFNGIVLILLLTEKDRITRTLYLLDLILIDALVIERRTGFLQKYFRKPRKKKLENLKPLEEGEETTPGFKKRIRVRITLTVIVALAICLRLNSLEADAEKAPELQKEVKPRLPWNRRLGQTRARILETVNIRGGFIRISHLEESLCGSDPRLVNLFVPLLLQTFALDPRDLSLIQTHIHPLKLEKINQVSPVKKITGRIVTPIAIRVKKTTEILVVFVAIIIFFSLFSSLEGYSPSHRNPFENRSSVEIVLKGQRSKPSQTNKMTEMAATFIESAESAESAEIAEMATMAEIEAEQMAEARKKESEKERKESIRARDRVDRVKKRDQQARLKAKNRVKSWSDLPREDYDSDEDEINEIRKVPPIRIQLPVRN